MHQFQDRDYINLVYFVHILLPSQTMSGVLNFKTGALDRGVNDNKTE